ncbi:Clp protease N-terminal domain-containing protein [Streptomyces sp. NPDC093252]|uniref:Clp protease N-terminal domain-containing protein n=1 Tax=Streptomyces sp. NPDC093252 TaxID=3154980 RepID=UPI00342F92F6
MTYAKGADGVGDVHHRIPRQPASDLDSASAAAPRAVHGAGPGAELTAVLAGARRRAVRDGDRQIDTAHLLHSLLEADPEVRAACDDDGPRLARLFGYLVQRSIGYGLRWQGTVEDSGALPVVTVADGYSPLAAAALEHAGDRAARRGLDRPRGLDLLAGLTADPEARAVEVLSRAGIDHHQLVQRLESVQGG